MGIGWPSGAVCDDGRHCNVGEVFLVTMLVRCGG